MRSALALAALAACIDSPDPRWTLDHDRVVAARATPPGIRAQGTAVLDALIAHAGAPTTVEAPAAATAPVAPELVTFDGASWRVMAPGDQALASARTRLGLAADAPVPLEVVMSFPGPAGERVVTKTVWLGTVADNPSVPALQVAGLDVADTVAIPRGEDTYLSLATTARVSWLTSCGTLFQDDEPTSYLHGDDACTGELAAVVRAPDGGVAWRTWPIAIEAAP